MKIKLDDLKKLRSQTKAGIMNCRKALIEAKGDLKKAVEILKQKGAACAEKKKDRITAAGVVAVYMHNNGQIGAMVKLCCETDFVANTQEFKKLAHELAMQVAAMDPKNIKSLLEQDYIRQPGTKIADLVKQAIGKLGENIKIAEIVRLEI
jgi:elongation factor Ts